MVGYRNASPVTCALAGRLHCQVLITRICWGCTSAMDASPSIREPFACASFSMSRIPRSSRPALWRSRPCAQASRHGSGLTAQGAWKSACTGTTGLAYFLSMAPEGSTIAPSFLRLGSDESWGEIIGASSAASSTAMAAEWSPTIGACPASDTTSRIDPRTSSGFIARASMLSEYSGRDLATSKSLSTERRQWRSWMDLSVRRREGLP